MKRKAIVFTKPNTAELLTEEFNSELMPNQVLVRTEVSTISSGTERAQLIGEVDISILSYDTEAIFPRRVGYSAAGTVIEVGSEVTSVKVGDRVAISNSTHSQYLVCCETSVYKIIDDNITFQEAALMFIGIFPLLAIRKCQLELGESVIVMGMGVLGLIAVKLLKAAGATPIIAVDPVREKRELALQYGADYVFDPFEKDFAQKVKEVTNGGAQVAIEVTGNGGALNGVLDCMKKFGRVALLGCTRRSDFQVDFYHKVHGPGISLIGANNWARPDVDCRKDGWTAREDIYTFMRLIKYGKLNLAEIIEEIHSPEEAPEVFARLAKDSTFPVVQFDWSKLQ